MSLRARPRQLVVVSTAGAPSVIGTSRLWRNREQSNRGSAHNLRQQTALPGDLLLRPRTDQQLVDDVIR